MTPHEHRALLQEYRTKRERFFDAADQCSQFPGGPGAEGYAPLREAYDRAQEAYDTICETMDRTQRERAEAVEELYRVLEHLVYCDTSPFGQIDGDEAFVAALNAGALARMALGLPRDGTADPAALDNETYAGPELPSEWKSELDELTRKTIG